MSIALFSLAEPTVAQVPPQGGKTRTPPKRQTIAQPDAVVVPEPR